MKHKHAELIKAWADGAEIERMCFEFTPPRWEIEYHPEWFDGNTYRIKPERKRYRVAKFPGYAVAANNDEYALEIESIPEFIEWITDWIEYD